MAKDDAIFDFPDSTRWEPWGCLIPLVHLIKSTVKYFQILFQWKKLETRGDLSFKKPNDKNYCFYWFEG